MDLSGLGDQQAGSWGVCFVSSGSRWFATVALGTKQFCLMLDGELDTLVAEVVSGAEVLSDRQQVNNCNCCFGGCDGSVQC